MRNWLKEPFLVTAFLLAGMCLPAQNDFDSFGNGIFGDGIFDDGIFDDGTNFPVLTGEEQEAQQTPQPETPEMTEPAEKKPLRMKNRTVELSIVNIGFDFSNDFIAVSDIVRDPFYLLENISDIVENPGLIWNDPVVIDMDNFFDGFRFNIGTSIKPFALNFNWKDKWGVGLDVAHIDISGNLSLSGSLVTISETKKDKFGVGGAVYADTGVPVFFHYRDFKIKLRPAVYVPVVYTEPKVTYTFTNVVKEIVKEIDEEEYVEVVEGTRYDITYDMKIYSLVSMEGIQDGDVKTMSQSLMDNAWDIPKKFGYDFGLSVEYPWRYDTDIGVNVVNIPVPFASARLNHYMHVTSSLWVDLSEVNVTEVTAADEQGNTKTLNDLKGIAYDYPEELATEYKYNAGGKKIYRPFSMIFYAHYRPYESHPLTLIPSLGFSINYLYPEIAAIEGGLSARYDAGRANMFITTVGINYNDRRWINSLDFIMNLRAFEFDLGISSQSQDFVRSWQGAGLSVYIALKFGW